METNTNSSNRRIGERRERRTQKRRESDSSSNPREGDVEEHQSKMILEIIDLKYEFDRTTDKLIKEISRQEKIMLRSDKRQKNEYDQLQTKLEEVKSLSLEIENTQREVVYVMGSIGETRSKETGYHVKRVAEYSRIFARHYGLSEIDIELLAQASPMHDIGKVAIPDIILNKPGRHTPEETVIMQTHAMIGYEMLKHSNRPLLRIAATIAHEHHEKYNGKGYPMGLMGKNISIEGRITAIADVFDALGSDRVYKKAWNDEKIFNLFNEEKGEHFDPDLIDIFFDNLDEFFKVREEFKDL